MTNPIRLPVLAVVVAGWHDDSQEQTPDLTRHFSSAPAPSLVAVVEVAREASSTLSGWRRELERNPVATQ